MGHPASSLRPQLPFCRLLFALVNGLLLKGLIRNPPSLEDPKRSTGSWGRRCSKSPASGWEFLNDASSGI